MSGALWTRNPSSVAKLFCEPLGLLPPSPLSTLLILFNIFIIISIINEFSDSQLLSRPGGDPTAAAAIDDLEYLEMLYITASDQMSSKKPLPLIVIDTGQDSSKLKEYGTPFCKYQFVDLDVESIRSMVDDLSVLITTMSCSSEFMRDDRLKRWYPPFSNIYPFFVFDFETSFPGLVCSVIILTPRMPS